MFYITSTSYQLLCSIGYQIFALLIKGSTSLVTLNFILLLHFFFNYNYLRIRLTNFKSIRPKLTKIMSVVIDEFCYVKYRLVCRLTRLCIFFLLLLFLKSKTSLKFQVDPIKTDWDYERWKRRILLSKLPASVCRLTRHEIFEVGDQNYSKPTEPIFLKLFRLIQYIIVWFFFP